MEVILIVGVLIAIGLAFVSAMIASGKGRSGFGWFVLTLIFPIAILFVLIAGPVSGAAQERPAQTTPSGKMISMPIAINSPSTPNFREPTIPPSGGGSEPSESSPALKRSVVSAPTAAMTSDGGTTTNNQVSTLDWEMLLKYDPDVMRSVDKLRSYGEPAIEEFKRAYAAVGGDRTVINHITDVIIKDWEQKKLDRQKEEIALAEEERTKFMELSEEERTKIMALSEESKKRENLKEKVLKALDKDKNNKLDIISNILDLQLKKRDDTKTYVKIKMGSGFVVNHFSGRDEMVSDIVKNLNDDELDRLATALE